MSWSYSGNPLASPKDEVRFLTGDTNSADPQLQDEEIAYTLTLAYGISTPPPTGNFVPAAWCVDAIIGKYARLTDKSVGDLHISYGQRLKSFQALANKLRMRAALAGVPVYAGGQSLSEKWALDADADRVQPASKIDGMDNVLPNNTDPSTSP